MGHGKKVILLTAMLLFLIGPALARAAAEDDRMPLPSGAGQPPSDGPPPAQQAPETLHQQAYACLQDYAPECEETCLTCHTEAIAGAVATVKGQLWNPATVRVDEAFPGLVPVVGSETEEDVWASLPKEQQSCRECHGDHVHAAGLHPVGTAYSSDTFDNKLNSEPAGLKLYDGMILCTTCHDPHVQAAALLKKENRRSALCFSCHLK